MTRDLSYNYAKYILFIIDSGVTRKRSPPSAYRTGHAGHAHGLSHDAFATRAARAMYPARLGRCIPRGPGDVSRAARATYPARPVAPAAAAHARAGRCTAATPSPTARLAVARRHAALSPPADRSTYGWRGRSTPARSGRSSRSPPACRRAAGDSPGASPIASPTSRPGSAANRPSPHRRDRRGRRHRPALARRAVRHARSIARHGDRPRASSATSIATPCATTD
jgi:hypothetical protein